LSDTEGAYAYIASAAIDTGCNSGTLNVRVQINGNTVSTVSNSNDGGTDSENYIAMYINGSWRIIGYGNDSANAGTTNDTADFAEWITYAGATQPQPGELLSADSAGGAVSTSSGAYDKNLIGVVSTSPYQVGGADDGHSVILALTGRVPVKVNLENGPILPGDPLTSSSTPGEAMKAIKAGRIIGTALTGYDGSQQAATVTVQLHAGFNDPLAGTGQLEGDQSVSGGLTVSGNTALQGSTAVANGLSVGGATTLQGGLDVSGASTLASLTVNGTLTVEGDLAVNGNATITSITAGSGTINGDFHVLGASTADTLSVNGLANIGQLNVTGNASIANLTVSGGITTNTVTVTGLASFGGDVKMTAAVNTRQATLKTFKSSKAIQAGSVVILDDAPGNEGKVTTSTTTEDTRVIGVAVTTVTGADQDVDVAIGGWVQVRVDTTLDGNGQPPAALLAGHVLTCAPAEGTVHSVATPQAGAILGKTTGAQDANNLVWVLITLQ
jgi:hypothetical protein